MSARGPARVLPPLLGHAARAGGLVRNPPSTAISQVPRRKTGQTNQVTPGTCERHRYRRVLFSRLSGQAHPPRTAGVRVRRMMACRGWHAYCEARGGGRGWHDLRARPHAATAAGQADPEAPVTAGVRARPVAAVLPAVHVRPAVTATRPVPNRPAAAATPAVPASRAVVVTPASLVSPVRSVSPGTPATAVVPVGPASLASQIAAAGPMPPGPGSSTSFATAAG